jgi:hypothetical protein
LLVVEVEVETKVIHRNLLVAEVQEVLELLQELLQDVIQQDLVL